MKKVLFVIDSLSCAGAEKSLITLLSLIDYSKYSVELLLFAYGGPLEKLVPTEVKLLSPLPYMRFTSLSFVQAIWYAISHSEYRMLWSRIAYSIRLRLRPYNNPQLARIFWESVSGRIKSRSEKYDIAISYAQGVPTFYVAEKVEAKRKFSWVNASYDLNLNEKKYQDKFYEHYEKIVVVSDTAKSIFIKTFPQFLEKIEVVYDLIDDAEIERKAEDPIVEDYPFNHGFTLLTIGRLEYLKGLDLALAACKLLKEDGVQFRWYVLGKGPLQEEIEDFIKRNGLENDFVLLGVTDNPYPYIKHADFYIQTSRTEGYGLAIAEARLLNIPVVSTRFESVHLQIRHGVNGLVVDMNPRAIYEGIKELMQNPLLCEQMIANLQMEKKGNSENIDRFYRLID